MNDDLKKAQLVTERYWELQGLRGALIGAAFGVGAGTAMLFAVVAPSVDGEIWTALAVGVGLLAIIPGMIWLDRFYARAFGRLRPTAKARRFGLVIVPGLLLIPAIVATPHYGPRGYVAFFAGWAIVGMWIAVRDWPFRTHHLLDVVAGLLGAAVLWKLSTERAAWLGFLWGLLTIGAAAMVSGFRDHQLLAGTLTSRHSGEESAEIRL